MEGICSTHVIDESDKLKEREHLGNMGIDGRVIYLQRILSFAPDSSG
jgi:hypothetical protein